MSLIVCMSVWNEEELLPGALASLEDAGVDEVWCFDGAWRGGKDGRQVFGNANGNGGSTDRTEKVARKAAKDHGLSFHWVGCPEPYPSQEQKRTHMFHACAAKLGDHIFVFDADERVEGRFPDPLPEGNAHLMVKCVGENDLPGIRGVWPNGDYCPDYKPEFRLFAWAPDLECLYPGRYWWNGRIVWQYVKGTATPNLPILGGVSFTHHGNDRSEERKAQKIAYYEFEHPERTRWMQALQKEGMG